MVVQGMVCRVDGVSDLSVGEGWERDQLEGREEVGR